MDIATLGGIVGTLGFLIFSMATTATGLPIFIDPGSFIIVIIGSTGAVIAQNPMDRIKKIPKYTGIAFKNISFDKKNLITSLVEFSEKARKEGLLSLDDSIDDLQDDFMRSGMRLVVDGSDPEIIKAVLTAEIDQLEIRHSYGINIYKGWEKYAPAFGMVGTLIGLIALMGNLEDKAALGSSMAIALITTLYGSIAANLIFGPIAAKLEDKHNDEVILKEMVVEGILSIQAGDNPRILESKLITYIEPNERKSVLSEGS